MQEVLYLDRSPEAIDARTAGFPKIPVRPDCLVYLQPTEGKVATGLKASFAGWEERVDLQEELANLLGGGIKYRTAASHGRCLIVSNQGWIGVAGHPVRRGDKMCMISGLSLIHI